MTFPVFDSVVIVSNARNCCKHGWPYVSHFCSTQYPNGHGRREERLLCFTDHDEVREYMRHTPPTKRVNRAFSFYIRLNAELPAKWSYEAIAWDIEPYKER